MSSRGDWWWLLLGAGLGACSSGGSAPPVASVPAIPTPVPTPPPTPTPTPVPTLDTPEYRRSGAAVQANVLPAWEAGRNGTGVTVGIVDTGIATGSAEFAGRIAPESRDVTGAGRPISDEDGHGTAVAGVLAAARNGQSIVGIAPEARLAIFRGDRQGTCTTQDGCSFSDSSVAAGVNAATDAGARVINLSLGGSPGTQQLRSAFSRATGAGVVLVVSAGNDGGAEVDVFPGAALASGDRRFVIVAGAATAGREIADFSNRAGSSAANFLLAPGVNIRGFDQAGTEFLYSGGSIAAPVVAGAVALLAEAFPSLSGAAIVELLLDNADDLGAPGVDPVYGRGLLNIGRAFRPSGTTTLAGTRIAVSAVDNGTLGPPMGDGKGFTTALGPVVVTDRYERRYALDVAPSIRRAGAGRLAGALADAPAGAAGVEVPAGSLRLGVRGVVRSHVAGLPAGADIDAPLGLAQKGLGPRSAAAGRLADTAVELGAARPGTVSFRVAAGSGLAAPRLPGEAASPSLVAADALAVGGSAAAIRARTLAGTRVGPVEVAAARTSAVRGLAPSVGLASSAGIERSSLALRWGAGALGASVSMATEREEGALLGTRLSPAFGLLGGRHRYLGGALDFDLGPIALRGAFQQGWHEAELARGRVLADSGGIISSAWSAAASAGSRMGIWSLAFGSPQAVTGGGFTVSPGDGSAHLAPLAVTTRELVGELALERGPFRFHVFAREHAGHREGLTDAGAAIRFSTSF